MGGGSGHRWEEKIEESEEAEEADWRRQKKKLDQMGAEKRRSR